MKSTLLLLFAALAAGCSHLDFNLSSDQPPWGESYASQDAASTRTRQARFASALAKWRTQELADEYLIGPGDVLEISVLALEEPDRISRLKRTVSRQGTVSLPWVGEVRCAGRSSLELENAVKKAYEGRYLREPQVSVLVTEYRSVPVVVTGAVGQPGLYHLRANASTVLECLALAGGLSANSGQEVLIVRAPPNGDGSVRPAPVSPAAALANGHTLSLDLRELVDRGNMTLNLRVNGGDVLIVPARVDRYVYVLGYVRSPGAYRLEPSGQLDALRAVARGGGLTSMARPANSYLVRRTRKGQTAIPVDLEEIASGELPPLYLEPGDTLVVGTSAWARMFEFLAPNVGASVSASASVAP